MRLAVAILLRMVTGVRQGLQILDHREARMFRPIAWGALIAGLACAGSAAQAAPPAKATLATLQEQAQTACLCERTGKGPSACWGGFDHDTARYGPPRRDDTACAPVSTRSVCFGNENKDGFCVTTGYRPEYSELTLCTSAEARAVENAWMRVMDQAAAKSDQPRSTTPADAEARRLAQSFINGADPGNPPTSGDSCAG